MAPNWMPITRYANASRWGSFVRFSYMDDVINQCFSTGAPPAQSRGSARSYANATNDGIF